LERDGKVNVHYYRGKRGIFGWKHEDMSIGKEKNRVKEK